LEREKRGRAVFFLGKKGAPSLSTKKKIGSEHGWDPKKRRQKRKGREQIIFFSGGEKKKRGGNVVVPASWSGTVRKGVTEGEGGEDHPIFSQPREKVGGRSTTGTNLNQRDLQREGKKRRGKGRNNLV